MLTKRHRTWPALAISVTQEAIDISGIDYTETIDWSAGSGWHMDGWAAKASYFIVCRAAEPSYSQHWEEKFIVFPLFIFSGEAVSEMLASFRVTQAFREGSPRVLWYCAVGKRKRILEEA